MRLLLDSQALIWAVDDKAKLSRAAHAALGDPNNERLLSAASIWEISIKAGLGKLPLSLPFNDWMSKATTDLLLVILPITVAYADAQAKLPKHHGDPFDRMLIAQAQVEGMPIVSIDHQFDAYGVPRLW